MRPPRDNHHKPRRPSTTTWRGLEPLEPRTLLSGLTVITHGYMPLSNFPTWVSSMADAIADRAGSQTAVYKLRITDSTGSLAVQSFTKISGTNPSSSNNGEAIVMIDWSTVSGTILFVEDLYSTEQIAPLVMPYLTSAQPSVGISEPLARGPIHLIGHSRGGSLISEIAKNLAYSSIWVDQLTPLDPHPVITNGDPNSRAWTNVVFADNYRQTAIFPTGDSVNGALDRDLTSLDPGHDGVHAYYHGTIDLTATNDGGNESIPSSWYIDPARDATGFYYSRIVGGTRPTSAIGTNFGGSGSRNNLTPTQTTWPNIGNISYTKAPNNTLNVTYQYQKYSAGNATITWFLDSDTNPSNNNNVATLSGAIDVASTGSNVLTDATTLTTTGDAQKIYARITDGTRTRYAYLGAQLNATPIGSLDVATRQQFSGWAYDADAGATSVNVRFDIDSVAGTPFLANLTRSDLTAVLGSSAHGFSITPPAMNNDAHLVEMYVQDASSGNYTKVVTTNVPAVVQPTFTVTSTNLTAAYGESITLLASFTGGTYIPTGNVTFYRDATPLGPAIIDANGQAAMTFQFLPPGSHNITAQYPGDTNVLPVTSNTINQSIAPSAVTGTPTPRYRLYNPALTRHLYTTDLNEYNTLAAYGWNQEGVSCFVYTAPATLDGIDTIPNFRLYNAPTFTHFWTTDANEYNTLRLFPEWTAEGVDGYVFPTNVTNSLPLYRLNYPYGGQNLHLWTTDANENAVLASTYGWIQEGIAAYVIDILPVPLPAPDDPFSSLELPAIIASTRPAETTGFLVTQLPLVG